MGALGPTVTLVFAGDSKKLSDTLKKVEGETDGLGKKLDGMSRAAGWSLIGLTGAVVGVGGALAAVPTVIAGIGIEVARHMPAVKHAFTDLKTHVLTQLKQMTAPFQPALVGIAHDASAAFDRISPSLKKMFADVAPMVRTVADAVIRFVTGAMPGLQKALVGARPMVDAIAKGFATLGPAVGQMFANMSKSGPGAAKALTQLFNIIAKLLPVIGTLVGWVAKFSGWLIPLTAGLYVGIKAAKLAQAAFLLFNITLEATPIGWIILGIGLLVAGLIYLMTHTKQVKRIWNEVWTFVKRITGDVVNWVVNKWNGLVHWFERLPGKIGSIFRSIGNLISWPFRKAFSEIRSLWNNTIGAISFTIPSWVPGLGGDHFGFPKMHTGGIVPGSPGSEHMAILQAGERVIPANHANDRSGGTVISFGGNVDSAFATAFMKLVRTGQIQIATA